MVQTSLSLPYTRPNRGAFRFFEKGVLRIFDGFLLKTKLYVHDFLQAKCPSSGQNEEQATMNKADIGKISHCLPAFLHSQPSLHRNQACSNCAKRNWTFFSHRPIQIQIISLPINPKYNSTQYTTPKYIQENRTTQKNKLELKITKQKLYMIVFKIDYGIRGTALSWFSSYLSNRSQYVSVNGHNSSHLNVTCGVPQRSVLGPLLFLIYINDLPKSCNKLSFYQFADDTNIYFESDNLNHLEKVVNKELMHVKKWLDANKLALNIDKTNFIMFHSPQHSLDRTVSIKIGREHVNQAKYVKFLGLLLDENLNWRYHLSELSKKLARTCGIFFNIRQLLPTNVLVSLYYSLFASFLQYGIIVWGLACDTHTKPIYLLQKKVVRAIAFKNFTSPSTPIFSELKILKLYDLSNLKLLTFVYESVNLISPTFFHNFFETLPSVHQYDTRLACRGDIFMMHKNTLQYGLKSIRYSSRQRVLSPRLVYLLRELLLKKFLPIQNSI